MNDQFSQEPIAVPYFGWKGFLLNKPIDSDYLRKMADKMDKDKIVYLIIGAEYDYETETYNSPIVSYKIESPEATRRRLYLNKINKEQSEERAYQNYLKLKEKYEPKTES